MNKKTIFSVILILAVALLTSAAIIFGPQTPFTSPGPDEVVENFYQAYLGYEGNPLVDKIYQGNGNLSPDFIQFLDKFTQDGMMYDPILCAQDKPGSFTIKTVEKDGDQAFVVVNTDFEGHEFGVNLILDGNDWLIDQVECQ
ncbi:MAG: DUF3828 domain-containing protein [Anaerolineales bacterium]|nr:DUF3828 domain-containing protein [Anaerolineales bacterium]